MKLVKLCLPVGKKKKKKGKRKEKRERKKENGWEGPQIFFFFENFGQDLHCLIVFLKSYGLVYVWQ